MTKNRRSKKDHKSSSKRRFFAFTLVEIVVVIAIIGILAAISIVSYGEWNRSVLISSMKSDLLQASSAMESALTFGNKYPDTIPASFKSSGNVVLAGGGYDGGKTYCIAASSPSNSNVKYYISSINGIRNILEGDCSTQTLGVLNINAVLNSGNVVATITPITCTTGVAQYSIKSRTNGGEWSTYSLWSTSLTSSQTANDGVKYEYQSRARCYISESVSSAEKLSSVATYIDPIPTPSRPNVVVTNSGDNTAYSWDIPVCASGTGIRYQYKYTISPAGYDSGWVATGANVFNATTVTKGQTYSIITQAQCYNANIASSWSVSSTTRNYYCPYDTFAKAYGTAYADRDASVIGLRNGGFVTAGYGYYSGMSMNAVLNKHNMNGDIIWTRMWSGPGSFNDEASSVVQTSDDGFAITGKTQSYGTAVDVFLAKYSSDGTLQWSRIWGGANADEGTSVVQTSDGGLVVTGATNSFGGGNTDAFLIKYDKNGNFLWNTTYGGINYDTGYAVIQTSDGGLALTGRTGSSGSTYDIFLAKFSSTGVLSWGRMWGGASYDEATSVIQTNDGGLVIVGLTNSYSSGGWPDIVLIKYNSAGTFVWNKMIGGTSTDFGKGIVELSDGTLGVLGMAASYGAGNYDLLLTKWSSDGNVLWSKTWGNSGQDGVYALAKTMSDGFIVSGSSSSYGGAGGDEAIVIKMNSAGLIDKCVSPTTCQSPTITASSPAAAMNNNTMPVANPAATMSSPTATSIDSASLVITNIIAN